MITAEHLQTLAEFRESTAATIDRLNQTGEPEGITVDGEVRAVLVPPAAYDAMAREYQLARDVEAMRGALQEIDDGKGLDARTMFDQLRAELLAMKAAGTQGGT